MTRRKIKLTGMCPTYISEYVNQVTHELIGYKFFYKNGKVVFNKEITNLCIGTICNPLIDIKQVGIARK